MSDWFLHSRDGNSFNFKHAELPDSFWYSFTLTYLRNGYTILTGDMGSLVWVRQEPEFDYRFPNENDEDLRYFAEKVKGARADQITKDWNEDRAKKEVIDSIICEFELENTDLLGYPDYVKEKIEYIQNSIWNSEYSMYEGLFECDPYGQWDEVEPGRDYTYDLKRKFEMVKSVSDQILAAVGGVDV